MARSPLPNIPRLARKRRRKAEEFLLACPRISPEWELAALKALIKPQTKDSILHRTGEQEISGATAEQIQSLIEAFGKRTLFRPEIHWPMEGDYVFAASVSVADTDLARALSAAISRLQPESWLTCGRLLVHDGRFYRRRRGVRLELVEAADIRIPRELRAVLEEMRVHRRAAEDAEEKAGTSDYSKTPDTDLKPMSS